MMIMMDVGNKGNNIRKRKNICNIIALYSTRKLQSFSLFMKREACQNFP